MLFTRGAAGMIRSGPPRFGLMFDIDGVLVRGKDVLPFAPKAFQKLVHPQTGAFRVPTVFVTNAGNSLRQSKADKLSEMLGVPISEEQVVMSHSPLRGFTDYHDKHVFVSGQGPVDEIAKNLGFNHTTTIDQLRAAFPLLDAVDIKRRMQAPPSSTLKENNKFPHIEAIVLIGEPVRWETSLQLTLDILVTNGHPSYLPHENIYPHIPILACNMDLQWMAEAVLPRFGHGAYLLCLENLYKKVTGHDLEYKALVGKPSEITYHHAEYILQEEAARNGCPSLDTIYFVGDNICTDIYGANLYNSYLNRVRESGAGSSGRDESVDALVGGVPGARNCFSVLVQTGIYSPEREGIVTLEHSPRDFLPVEDSFKKPTLLAQNVLEAISLIFKREDFR
eukprot:TRINITY_DN697_c0_g3_i1.p1 TRINITY_DN697_c0_g3~~TRINITY_DN697_c0_g3_i1.p1  ORF type:complete len:393 (-),score=84.45 TRINITY_DN697_c0_g3_i1:524-1702(-)